VVDRPNGLLARTPERQLSLLARHLPALYAEPIEEPAVRCYPAWTGSINGRQVYSLAAGTNELWCTTSGGVLRWKWSGNARYTWFSSEHGLPSTRFEWIVLDGQRHPWVASKTFGVCYWDDQIWRQLSSAEGLPSDHIVSMAVDLSGTVWIATKQGLGYVAWQEEKPEWHFYDLLAAGIPTLQPTCLAFDADNRLYAGTAFGLFAPSQGEKAWRRYTLVDGLPSNQITTLLCSRDSSIWAGTASGLVHITFTNGVTRCPEIKGAVHAISQEPDKDGIWILTSEALWRYRDNSLEHLDAPLLEKAGNLYAVTAGIEKSWIGSEVGVIEYSTGPALIRTPGVRDLPDGGISSLAVDTQNNLWVGAATGVWVYQNREWRSLHPGNQLISPITNISGIQSMADGAVWVGSWQNGNRGGLRLFRGGIEIPSNRNGIPEMIDAMALSTVFNATGTLWVATGDRLYYQDGKEWRQTDGPEPGGLILKLLVDPQNRIWSGLYAGLYMRKWNNWKKILDGLSIYALATDGSSTIWCGTSHGLYIIKREIPELLELDLPSCRVQSICLVDGVVWLGTGAGLVRLKDGQIQIWDTKNSGLVGQNVKSLAMDANHILWVGTTSGLCQFDTSRE